MFKNIMLLVFLNITSLSFAQADGVICSSLRCRWSGLSGDKICDVFSTSFTLSTFKKGTVRIAIVEWIFDEKGEVVNFGTLNGHASYFLYPNALTFNFSDDDSHSFAGKIPLKNSLIPDTGSLSQLTIQNLKDASSKATIDYVCSGKIQ